MQTVTIKTVRHSQALDITYQVSEYVKKTGLRQGWCQVFVKHTTAGVCVNEAADPSVMADLLAGLERMVPWEGPYTHAEGNSAAHIKSILSGSSVRVPVVNSRLDLGTWQGIFFLEFDGPRTRNFVVDVLAGSGE
jgi:secondary thiamine-phosphate synthase enzyme